MSTAAKVALVLGSVALVVGVLVAVVALLGTSSEDTDAAPLAEVPASFERFEDPDGDFVVDLEPTWIGLPLRGDVSRLGATIAPDDPDLASKVDAFVSTMPRQVVFAAFDGERAGEDAFAPNINLIPFPRDGASLSEIEVGAPEGVKAFGAGGAHVERIDTTTGVGLRLTYRFDAGGPLAGVEGVQYYVLSTDTVWVLTMTSDDMAADRTSFDASAASFTLTE